MLSIARKPRISRDVSSDASFLYGKAAVLGADIKETLCINWCRLGNSELSVSFIRANRLYNRIVGVL